MALALDVQTASHATTGEWLWCVALLVVPFLVVAGVFAAGSTGRRGVLALIERPALGLAAATGRPAWSSAGVEIGVWALIVAATGFFWDVAWHIDLGRDQELFTPPHTMIVAGLIGLAAAGVTSIVIASLQQAEVGFRIGRVRVPWGAAGLLMLGGFATIGFPLDDLWHATYGIDVTMWSPTHLTMISGAALAPVAVWILYREGGPATGRRWARYVAGPALAGALVVALSAFQLEFDDGVPQWQMLYQPVLIALASTVALTTARVALGRGWALITALLFLLIRGTLTLIVGVALGHVVSTIPLLLGVAVCIEAAFTLLSRRSLLVQALAGGALGGTAGMAVEWGWTHVWGYQPWQPRLLSAMWVPFVAACAGALVGAGLGAVLRGARVPMPRTALVLAGAGVVVALAVPFPRTNVNAQATIDTTAVGPARATTDRYGLPSTERDVLVDVRMSPAGVADGADVFRVIAWQGGGRVAAPLVESDPGHWTTATPVPTGGAWKTLVILLNGAVVSASPVSMPADPQYGKPPIPVAHGRSAAMVPASALLMREFSGGLGPVAIAAYAWFGIEVLATIGLYVVAAMALSRRPDQVRERPRMANQATAMTRTTITTT